MITKEQFCKMLREIEKIHNNLKKILKDNPVLDTYIFHESDQAICCIEIIKVLEEMIGDKNEGVAYFVYDMEFGKKLGWKDKDGKTIDTSTPEKLYDFLTK